MWPEVFSSIYTAKSGKIFRKNAIISPLYTLMLILVFFAGFAAILKVPGFERSRLPYYISIETFDRWFIGIIGGAGLLTALVPGSMLLMSAATLLAKNIFQPFAPSATNRRIGQIASI